MAFPFRENFMKFKPAQTPGFHLHELASLLSALGEAGFVEIAHQQNDDLKFGMNCLIGTKPAS